MHCGSELSATWSLRTWIDRGLTGQLVPSHGHVVIQSTRCNVTPRKSFTVMNRLHFNVSSHRAVWVTCCDTYPYYIRLWSENRVLWTRLSTRLCDTQHVEADAKTHRLWQCQRRHPPSTGLAFCAIVPRVYYFLLTFVYIHLKSHGWWVNRAFGLYSPAWRSFVRRHHLAHSTLASTCPSSPSHS